jgi:glutamate carboxypeptidase
MSTYDIFDVTTLQSDTQTMQIPVPDLPDLAGLPFDSAAMADGLRRWVEQESPTYDRSAVDAMMDLAAHDLFVMGARIQRIPGRGGFGDCVKAEFPHPRAGELCFGPGALDMKGGNYLSLEAIRQLQRAGIDTPLPVTVLFTSDEEVGSPSTREIIEAEARRSRFVLVPEPGRRNGGVVTGRYAIARFRVSTHGKPSHAGLRLAEGVSAIREMAHQTLAIESMTDPDTGYSVGVVQGGQWVNCVSTTCNAQVLVSATTDEKLAIAIDRMSRLKPVGSDVRVEVVRDVVRPVWTRSEASWALYEHAAAIADTLGFEIPHQSSGGGSDGNFTGALGIPTLDGLGVRGDLPHTLEEHIVTESLAERGRLMAGLLASLRD